MWRNKSRRPFTFAPWHKHDQTGKIEDGMTNERETTIAGVMPSREPRPSVAVASCVNRIRAPKGGENSNQKS
jgi:hypothetical protein